MKTPLCDEQLRFQPASIEDESLNSWHIANCVLNALLSITAVIFNSVTIQALRRPSSLSNTLKTLLLSAAVSDLGVGLLVHPLHVFLLVKWLQLNSVGGPTCSTYAAFIVSGILFSSASFFGVMALSADRFLVIHLHLRYSELVTHRRVVFSVVSSWVICVVLSIIRFCVTSITAIGIITVVGIACLVASAVFYCKIYLAVRRHKKQIQTLQVQRQENAEMVANLASGKKSAVGTFYVFLVFLMCYLPMFCIFAARPISSGSKGTFGIVFSFTWTLVLLNSTLNPVIYFWKMRQIRRAIMNILRNTFPIRRRSTPFYPNAQTTVTSAAFQTVRAISKAEYERQHTVTH